jgi:hypothetical protein
MPHVWQFLAGFLPEARESLDAAGAFVRAHVRAGRVHANVVATTPALPASHETRVPRA